MSAGVLRCPPLSPLVFFVYRKLLILSEISGSVPQNDPEPPPSPETGLQSPPANPAATEPSARKVALGAQITALEAGVNAFVAQGRKEMAQFRKTYGGV